MDDALVPFPEVRATIERTSDRLQALAGSTMGPLGDRLDAGVSDRWCSSDSRSVRYSREISSSARGNSYPGLVIVGVGYLELEGAPARERQTQPGRSSVR